jgi:Na+-transporting NADH:ubiquinone oxidoreductase subunit NqrC
MKITSEWLQRQHACLAGIEWFKNQAETKPEVLIAKLIDEERLDWANWLIVRVLTHKQQIAYAIFAAEQVLEIFEKHNTEDKRPRIIIDTARAVLKRNTQKNREAAYYAVAAAKAAVYDSASYANADERAYNANAAAYYAAFAAAYGYAYSAAAAERAANAAAAAAVADDAKQMKSRILAFGFKLLRE